MGTPGMAKVRSQPTNGTVEWGKKRGKRPNKCRHYHVLSEPIGRRVKKVQKLQSCLMYGPQPGDSNRQSRVRGKRFFMLNVDKNLNNCGNKTVIFTQKCLIR